MHKIIITLLSVLFLATSTAIAATDNNVIKEPLKSLASAHSCGAKGCHTRINKEWSSTIHANSVPSKDPLVQAFFTYLEDKGEDTHACYDCHSPLKAIYGPDAKSPVFDEGVTCVFCHSIYGKSTSGGRGYKNYMIDLTRPGATPYTPSGEGAHDSKFISLFSSVDMCAGCHREGEADFIIQNDRKMICQTCHMPSKQNKRSADTSSKPKEKVYRHLFEGGHSETLMSMAVTINDAIVTTEEDQTTLEISFENGAYHSIPTGFPFRAIYIHVTAKDDNDEVLWQNYKDHPYDEDPSSYFGQIFDPKDDIYAHHVRDAKPVWEQKIPAKESVTRLYTAPSPSVAYFEVQVYYRLLTDRIVEKLALTSEDVPETLIMEDVFYAD